MTSLCFRRTSHGSISPDWPVGIALGVGGLCGGLLAMPRRTPQPRRPNWPAGVRPRTGDEHPPRSPPRRYMRAGHRPRCTPRLELRPLPIGIPVRLAGARLIPRLPRHCAIPSAGTPSHGRAASDGGFVLMTPGCVLCRWKSSVRAPIDHALLQIGQVSPTWSRLAPSSCAPHTSWDPVAPDAVCRPR